MVFEEFFSNINKRREPQENVEQLKLEVVRSGEGMRYFAGSEHHNHPAI